MEIILLNHQGFPHGFVTGAPLGAAPKVLKFKSSAEEWLMNLTQCLKINSRCGEGEELREGERLGS